MKFLADMGVSPLTVQVLRQAGYDAIHLIEEGLERMRDEEIVIKARQEERIILTFDLDFAELLALSKASLPNVIIFRLKNTVPQFVSSRLLNLISEYAEQLNSGAIVTVEDARYRVRQLPLQ